MLQPFETELDAVAEANRTARPFPSELTLDAAFAQAVSRYGGHAALRCSHDRFLPVPAMTYAELDQRAAAVAGRLQKLGVRPGVIVPLLVERAYTMVIGILGILKAGGAYLPLSPDDPADRIAYVVSDAGATLILVQAATAAKAPPGIEQVNLEDARLYEGERFSGPAGTAASDLAYVIYTSGSTGRPKGVMIEHRAVINRLDWMQQAYPLEADDVLLLKTSYCFDVSVWELFWWMLAGASLAVLKPRGEKLPPVLLDCVRQNRVTVVHFVPSMFSVFLEYVAAKSTAAPALTRLRRVFTSGEALSPVHVERFNALLGSAWGARLTNLYGPTEATVDATYYDCPTVGAVASVPIGRPIQNLRAYILNEGREAPVGETGELCLAGVGLARGYLNNPELTRQRFTTHPTRSDERIYRTGDLARWLPDGNIEYLGREDHQVKIRGLRIELGEIESTLRRCPGVTDCAVVVRKYSDSIILIVAYVVAAPGLDWDAMKQQLRSQLPEYMVPAHFEPLDALPLTASGKTDRKALPEPRLARRPA